MAASWRSNGAAPIKNQTVAAVGSNCTAVYRGGSMFRENIAGEAELYRCGVAAKTYILKRMDRDCLVNL
jgi:hypothetical protein